MTKPFTGIIYCILLGYIRGDSDGGARGVMLAAVVRSWLRVRVLYAVGSASCSISIGIPASCISVRYRSIPVPDWFRHRVFVHSGTGLSRSRTV
jgi:hypothetical protein